MDLRGSFDNIVDNLGKDCYNEMDMNYVFTNNV